MFSKKIQVVTHEGMYHADDVFATAVLKMYFSKQGKSIQIIRADREDKQLLESADVVYDVGGVYNPQKNRFDHHQRGKAGERPNRIPYAAFGLVWKKFGPTLVGKKHAEIIDQELVQAIDASDNGIDLSLPRPEFLDVEGLSFSRIISLFVPFENKSEKLYRKGFDKAVNLAEECLKAIIEKVAFEQKVFKDFEKIYKRTKEKRIITVSRPYGRKTLTDVAFSFEEVLYVVYPSSDLEQWSVVATRAKQKSFETKKPFPKNWRGLRTEALEKESAVPQVMFCHDDGFLCIAKTKESALLLAKKALTA
jgi:uncharacterized UPF0160 family protein